MNKYSGHTVGSIASNLSLWNVNGSNTIIGNSPAIRRQHLEMYGQRITHTTHKVMIDGRLVAEIREEIIPNGNGSNINIRGTGIGMGIGATIATDNSYFMNSNHGVSNGYKAISESNLKTSIVPLHGAAEVDLTPVKAQIDKEREQEREREERRRSGDESGRERDTRRSRSVNRIRERDDGAADREEKKNKLNPKH